jgi:hypothetical protein
MSLPFPLQHLYADDIERLAHVPKSKRPTEYLRIRRETIHRFGPAFKGLPKAALLDFLRALLMGIVARVAELDAKGARPPRPADGTHEVFVIRWPRSGRREKWSVEESCAGADWWGWVSDAGSFDEALRAALSHVEPNGKVSLLLNGGER